MEIIPKKSDSEKDAEVPSEKECTHGINRLNLGKPANDLNSDSKSENKSEQADNLEIEPKQLLAQRREGQMANKKIELTVLYMNVTY